MQIDSKQIKDLLLIAEKVRLKYPKIWAMGGNIQGNESYEILKKIVRRGYIKTTEEKYFIEKVWEPWKARHFNHTRINGFIASLKWLDVPRVGLEEMLRVINLEIKKKYPKSKGL
jgi:hypothetical protein